MRGIIISVAVAAIAAAPLSTASAQSAQSAQSAPDSTGPYQVVSVGPEFLILAAPDTRRRSGPMATVTVISIEPAASRGAGRSARLDATYEFDCRRDVFRTPVFAGYDADHRLEAVETGSADWETINAEGLAPALKRLACDGTRLDVEALNDLRQIDDFYQRWIREQ